MVYAMVQVSRAHLRDEDPAGWRGAYLISWGVILLVLILFLRGEPGALERNAAWLLLFPLGWFALHALLLRFAVALRELHERPLRAGAPLADAEEEEAEDDADAAHEAPSAPPWLTRTIAFAKSASVMLFLLLVFVIGENIAAMHAIDTAIAPHRTTVVMVLGLVTAAGFALFMASTIGFVLKGGQSGIYRFRERTGNLSPAMVVGPLITFLGAGALGVVVLPPGAKLLVMVTFAYAAARILIATTRRTPSTSRPPR